MGKGGPFGLIKDDRGHIFFTWGCFRQQCCFCACLCGSVRVEVVVGKPPQPGREVVPHCSRVPCPQLPPGTCG